ncbi:MAG: tetratricopeptide repeat protein [Spirochaetaceae bacterium]|jgi:tetratricopeptide (TPR) repeat protein|nr:tetratricopeptide repeat protein [Spirochaetaceae bacterium]
MFGFLKRLFGLASPVQQNIDPDEIAKEQWQADFSRPDEPGKPPLVRFSITSENQYRAYLEDGALCLGVKKTSCIAWAENMIFRYQDLDMKGRFRLDPRGGYAAAGFIFHMVDERTYYMVLVSNRGYFRLDLVRNSVPLALAGWTEAPYMSKSNTPIEFDLELITYGSRILLLINRQWAGNWNDASLPEGRIGFAAASYEPEKAGTGQAEEYTALAMLRSFSLDSRIEEAAARYDELEETALPEHRIRLAETFTALGQTNPALVQLRKAWERREILSTKIAAAEDAVMLAALQDNNTEVRFRPEKELFLGAKLAMALKLWNEAAEYIEDALSRKGELLPEFRNMKAALLYSQGSYGALIKWFAKLCSGKYKAAELFADPHAVYNLLGHAYFNSSEYQKAAEMYDRSFMLDEKNGITAKNAAAAYELYGQNKKALARYIQAGRAFLADDLYEELGLLIPKFRLLGETNWEAAALTGKWAFGIEAWADAEKELARAETLRREVQAEPDSALYYLQALLLVRSNDRRKALDLFKKAVKYAPDYPLFRFRLAENRYLLNNNAEDPELAADLEAALNVKEDEGATYGWIHNFAAQIALSRNDTEKAAIHLEKAASVLGEAPEIRVNRAVFLYLQGAEDKALELLKSQPEEDPLGLMTNCAGNLLVRSGRFGEANRYYSRALSIAPGNTQYRCNRASCLIKMGYYGEADNVLTAVSGKLTPDMLELIAYVAVKKGEYKRAEAAARSALKIDPDHVPSLLQLGWACAFTGNWDKLGLILDKLKEKTLSEEATRGLDDLEAWMNDALFRAVSCASCGRTWKVKRDPGPVPPLRIYAVPPDDMPAGTCPGCGKTFCVGCRKDALDESGRFVCPDCSKPLKLTDDGLKDILNIWAKENLKKKRSKQN